MGGGKGGSTNTNTTSNTSTIIPDWLTGASQQAVGMAQNLANTPAGAPLSTDQLVAGQSPYTTQAYQQVADQQGSANPAFNDAAGAYGGLLGQAAPQTADQINALSNSLYGNYQQGALDPASNLLGSAAGASSGLYSGAQNNSQNYYAGAQNNTANLYGGAMQGTAGLLGNYLGAAGPATAQQVGANTMSQMSPYAQSVVAPALQAGHQQRALADQGIAANANQVGAFGGSRMGVEEGVAAAQTALGTQQYIGNMMNQGYNAALTPGYNLASQASQQGYNAANTLAGQGFNSAANQAQQGYNSASALAGQGYNSAAAQAQQGYGTASLLGNLGVSGYNNATGQAQGLANTNLNAGLQAAQQLPGQAVTQAGLAQQQTGALQAAGTAQSAYQQQLLNAQLGQYYAAQQQPYQNLDTLLSAVGAVPYSTTGTSTGTQGQSTNPGLLNEITGGIGAIGSLAGTGAGIAKAFGA